MNPNVAAVASVADANDEGRINFGGNTVTVTDTQEIGFLLTGVDESGSLVVANGGTLSALTSANGGINGDVRIGNNGGGGAAIVGSLTVQDGGTLNVGRFLEASRSNGVSSFITIETGGFVSVGSEIRLGITGTTVADIGGTVFQDAGTIRFGSTVVNGQTGTAQVTLTEGGELYLNDVSGNVNDGIGAGSFLAFEGGELFIEGDRIASAQDYIDAGGFITTSPDFDISLVDVNGTTYTRVGTTAIPEPASAMLLGVGVLGLGLRRRR